nr:unnamed protein product [Spirometra erinaceieuropaei]
MAASSQLQLPRHGWDAENSGLLQDFPAWDTVMPFQLQYPAKAAEMKMVEHPRMFGVDGPAPCTVRNCRRDDGLVHLQFDVQLKAQSIPHEGLQRTEGLVGFAKPTDDLVVGSYASREGAS